MRVLIFQTYYLPGYKAGGPIRTIANMIEELGDEFDFWLVTRDRDELESVAYPNIKIDAWNEVGKANVYYASPRQFSLFALRRLAREIAPDVLYLNSFHANSTIMALLLRRLRLIPVIPAILAPRGEFSPYALKIKGRKKKLYRRAATWGKLYRGLLWQASSPEEAMQIKRELGNDEIVYVAPDIPVMHVTGSNLDAKEKTPKEPGKVRFIFLARIAPMKNLLFALKMLSDLSGQIELMIYGPIHDHDYWHNCQTKVEQMPGNVSVGYGGAVPNEQVWTRLKENHFLLLPTLGENFGHAILEALSAGCPVIISDRTPWLNLSEKSVGWDIPLGEPLKWKEILQRCVDMEDKAYQHHSLASCEFAKEWRASSDIIEQNYELFHRATEIVPM